MIIVKEGGYGLCEIIICVNGLDIEWGEVDVCVVVLVKLVVVLVFKVDDVVVVECYEVLIDEGDVSGDVVFWVMMEMLKVMFNVEMIVVVL